MIVTTGPLRQSLRCVLVRCGSQREEGPTTTHGRGDSRGQCRSRDPNLDRGTIDLDFDAKYAIVLIHHRPVTLTIIANTTHIGVSDYSNYSAPSLAHCDFTGLAPSPSLSADGPAMRLITPSQTDNSLLVTIRFSFRVLQQWASILVLVFDPTCVGISKGCYCIDIILGASSRHNLNAATATPTTRSH